MSIAAIILAAGASSRAGPGLPKPYRDIGEPDAARPVLCYSLATFLAHPEIDHLRIVIREEDRTLARNALRELDMGDVCDIVTGGPSRAASVAKGIEGLSCDYVLIHDGARPFVSRGLISRVIGALQAGSDGALPSLPLDDALWRVADDRLMESVPREGLQHVQTPQGFLLAKYAPLALDLAARDAEARDDAETALSGGLSVTRVTGERLNFKLTHPEDFDVANDIAALIRQRTR